MEKRGTRGYVLIDVVAGICILALGLAAFYGVIGAAYRQSGETQGWMEAANLAQSRMDQLAANSWTDNFLLGYCLPEDEIEGHEGKYSWKVAGSWESPPDLLRVRIRIAWLEGSRNCEYLLESMFYVADDDL